MRWLQEVAAGKENDDTSLTGIKGKPNDPKSMLNKLSLLWIQSKLSVQIQLLRGREEGDPKTWCSQLPKGMYTVRLLWKSFVILTVFLILRVQYTLSQETVEALKKPTFDVWHWEHNEVCWSCRLRAVTWFLFHTNQPTSLCLCDCRCWAVWSICTTTWDLWRNSTWTP